MVIIYAHITVLSCLLEWVWIITVKPLGDSSSVRKALKAQSLANINICKALPRPGAQEETRTPTGITPLASETSASTNFATCAFRSSKELK